MIGQAVEVTWTETTDSNEWTKIRGLPPLPKQTCVTVGYLVERDLESVTLAMSRTTTGVQCFVTIPRSAVTKIVPLRYNLEGEG